MSNIQMASILIFSGLFCSCGDSKFSGSEPFVIGVSASSPKNAGTSKVVETEKQEIMPPIQRPTLTDQQSKIQVKVESIKEDLVTEGPVPVIAAPAPAPVIAAPPPVPVIAAPVPVQVIAAPAPAPVIAAPAPVAPIQSPVENLIPIVAVTNRHSGTGWHWIGAGGVSIPWTYEDYQRLFSQIIQKNVNGVIQYYVPAVPANPSGQIYSPRGSKG